MKKTTRDYKKCKEIAEADRVALISSILRDVVDNFKGTSMKYDVCSGTPINPNTTISFPDHGVVLKLGFGDGLVTLSYDISGSDPSAVISRLNAILRLSKELVR